MNKKGILAAFIAIGIVALATYIGFVIGENRETVETTRENTNTSVPENTNTSPTSTFYPDRLCVQLGDGGTRSGDLSVFGKLSRMTIEKSIKENEALGTPREVCAFDQFRASLEYELKGEVESSAFFISSPADPNLQAKIRLVLVGFSTPDEPSSAIDVAIGKDLPGACQVYTPSFWDSGRLLIVCNTVGSEVGEGVTYLS